MPKPALANVIKNRVLMKILVKSISYIFLLILICIVLRLFTINTYEYSNSNGSLTFEAMPSKGRDLGMLQAKLKHCEVSGNVDTTVYRLFKKQYWKIWLWMDYRYSDYYNFPYKSWNVISKTRGEIRNKSSCQDF